ncbi:MAG: leucyl aminopeptidase [Pseudomonadota bacterium]
MKPLPTIAFSKPDTPSKGTVILGFSEGGPLGDHARALDEASGGAIERAMAVAEFKGKKKSILEIIAPHGLELDRIYLIGLGGADDRKPSDWRDLGGVCAGFAKSGAVVTVLLESVDKDPVDGADAAAFADGLRLRSYRFDRYKTKPEDEDEPKKDDEKPAKVTIALDDQAQAKKLYKSMAGVSDGVMLARDLVNEPANKLGPAEFADRAKALEKLGVKVDILTEKEMTKLGMRALLGVGQGSVRPSRIAVMTWKGGKAKDKPLAFIGKGVVFDTGGISLKPAGGMEDMKGDMGGAAAVTGLMHALAARKAKVNAIGAIGLVENMPDGNAQRPGDVVESMSGQTIEVINTDAEGRLVLADVLWYIQDKHKPQFMVDLATLTGAIMVALGGHNAGLFSNDDTLSDNLIAAGLAADEPVWRMPLGKDYDKMIDSKIADMKNVGGRWGGAITAAQFLQRFVNGTPWAHLDVAGTAMGSKKTDINESWGSGFGVRLLNQLVADHYE